MHGGHQRTKRKALYNHIPYGTLSTNSKKKTKCYGTLNSITGEAGSEEQVKYVLFPQVAGY